MNYYVPLRNATLKRPLSGRLSDQSSPYLAILADLLEITSHRSPRSAKVKLKSIMTCVNITLSELNGAFLFCRSVHKDPFPRWRKLAWSGDSSLLAFAHR